MKFAHLLEWLWRLAVLAALAWIGWDLHVLHGDLAPPPAADANTAAGPEGDPLQDGIDELRDDVAALTQKVDAILVVMARSR